MHGRKRPHRLRRTESPGLCFIPATGPAYSAPQPRCVEVCPQEALIRRESDGIVFIREEACVGCGACQKACPHHLIWVDPRKRKAVKCDQCKDRLDAGLDTACVTVCPTGALKLVRKERTGR